MQWALQNRNAGSARASYLRAAFGRGGNPRAQAAGRAAGAGAAGFPSPGSNPSAMQLFPRHRGLSSAVPGLGNGLCLCFGGVSIET